MAACGNAAITHTTAALRTSVQAIWVPPAEAAGAVTFEAYVFQINPGGMAASSIYRFVIDDGSGLSLAAAPALPSITWPLSIVLLGALVAMTQIKRSRD